MRVDVDRFMEDGFLIIPNVIPSARLGEMRSGYETVVDKQKKIWSSERGPDDAIGGVWETHQQPRINDC